MTRWGVVGALGMAGASAGLALAPPVAATGPQVPPASPPAETVTFDEPGALTGLFWLAAVVTAAVVTGTREAITHQGCARASEPASVGSGAFRH